MIMIMIMICCSTVIFPGVGASVMWEFWKFNCCFIVLYILFSNFFFIFFIAIGYLIKCRHSHNVKNFSEDVEFRNLDNLCYIYWFCNFAGKYFKKAEAEEFDK